MPTHKPQPEHDPADLARIVRVEPGAQSEAGRRIVDSGINHRWMIISANSRRVASRI